MKFKDKVEIIINILEGFCVYRKFVACLHMFLYGRTRPMFNWRTPRELC